MIENGEAGALLPPLQQLIFSIAQSYDDDVFAHLFVLVDDGFGGTDTAEELFLVEDAEFVALRAPFDVVDL